MTLSMHRHLVKFILPGLFVAACSTPATLPPPAPVVCGEGTWNHDDDDTNACAAWSDCAAGTFVSVAGTAASDRTCQPCGEGTYSTTANAASCTAWSDCSAGTELDAQGTTTTDRTCTPCGEGTYSTTANTAACTEWSACPAGTVLDEEGTATTDRTCTPCPEETFATTEDESCTPWEECAEGTFVDTEPTSSNNRGCAACPENTFSASTNAGSCADWKECAAGSRVDVDGTPTADRSCEPCAEGSFSTIANAAECTPWTPCAEGYVVTTAGSSTRDQVCTPAPSECANGVREGLEACDGTDLGGRTCASLSFEGGRLTCAADCTLDTSDCYDATLLSEDFSNAHWTLNVPVGTNGADPNFWVASDNEGGVSPGACGVANNGNPTLHVTSVFNPTEGTSYDAGGLCGLLFCPQSAMRAESPAFSSEGRSDLTLTFDYIAGGQGLVDNASVWMDAGDGWQRLVESLKSEVCGGGQGRWTTHSVRLPAEAAHKPSVRIGFVWVNNDDGVGTDPSVAIDNVRVTAREDDAG